MKNIEEIIKNTTEENVSNTNWTKAWSTKYPILANYQKEVDIPKYQEEIQKLLLDLEKTYNYNKLDAMLVLKEILYQTWKNNK